MTGFDNSPEAILAAARRAARARAAAAVTEAQLAARLQAREVNAVAGLLRRDAWHRALGHVMCQGVCSRWYGPAEVDEYGTCGGRECQRAAVRP